MPMVSLEGSLALNQQLYSCLQWELPGEGRLQACRVIHFLSLTASFDRVLFFLTDLHAMAWTPSCLPSACGCLGEGLRSPLNSVSGQPCAQCRPTVQDRKMETTVCPGSFDCHRNECEQSKWPRDVTHFRAFDRVHKTRFYPQRCTSPRGIFL